MGIIVPKGAAMALHLSAEYRQGILAGVRNFLDADAASENPYHFFDDYARHYAWDIGFQGAGSRLRKLGLFPGEVRRAWEGGEEELFRLLEMG